MSFLSSDLKFLNRKTVYQLIKNNDNMSRAEISRAANISKPTVMKIVEFLLQNGFVRELGAGESSIGRKPQLLRFNEDFGYAIGVDYNGYDLKIGIVDFSGKICIKNTIKNVEEISYLETDSFIDNILETVSMANITYENIYGICIGLPGAVNKNKKTVEMAPLVGVADSINYEKIETSIVNRLHIPVYIENDANLCAQGELSKGSAREHEDIIFIRLAKGIGAGIVLDGKVRQGKNYFAGELGYMVFDRQHKALCGAEGWFETVMHTELYAKASDISDDDANTLAQNLALLIVNVCMPLDVVHVVVGKFADTGVYNDILSKTESYIKQYTFREIILRAQKTDEPAILGGAEIVIHEAETRILSE